jgi:chromosome segregation ATPase
VFQDGAFEASLGTLRDALDRANERADAAEQGREVLREQIATLRADLSEAQDAADRHHAEAQAAQERADRAEGVRDSALEAANRADAEAARGRLADMERDNDARRALGRLARLRDAWRGRG